MYSAVSTTGVLFVDVFFIFLKQLSEASLIIISILKFDSDFAVFLEFSCRTAVALTFFTHFPGRVISDSVSV